MTGIALFAFKQLCSLILFQIKGLFHGKLHQIAINFLLLFIVTPLFLVYQIPHWIGFICDRLFFPQTRKLKFKDPVFISGVPRSGTTFLQRTLSLDTNLTTSTLWDCIIAPTVSQKWLYSHIGRLFKPILTPTKNWLSKRVGFLKKMEAIHQLGFNEAEEDFLFFLPIFSCFILIALFPRNHGIWQLSRPQICFSEEERDLVLDYYKSMIQRHLFFYGKDKRYLSKNPSFTPWLKDLKCHFPEASFILCVRTPVEAIPSQVSSLKPSLDLIGFDSNDGEFTQQINAMMASYYDNILDFKLANSEQTEVINMPSLNSELYFVIRAIYRMSQLSWSDALQKHYLALADQAKAYRSAHQYQNLHHGYFDSSQLVPAWPYDDKIIFNANATLNTSI